MRIKFFSFTIAAIVGCIVCYYFGFRSGIKQSSQEKDQRGLVNLTLAGYKAAESTNWTKVQSLLDVEIIGFTRDYESPFGVPTGTNNFVGRFAEAKEIANRVEKHIVWLESGLQKALGTNITVEIGK